MKCRMELCLLWNGDGSFCAGQSVCDDSALSDFEDNIDGQEF